MQKIIDYMNMVKFSHTIFAMPFALIGFFYALSSTGETLTLKQFGFVILCMVFARNAAMGFNRYIDRTFDKNNPRTANREVPAGIISPAHALIFVVINSLLFVGTTFFINTICFYLSSVALAVILGYSYMKRFTPLCHFVLSLGLSFAPIGAYLTVVGHFDIIPVLFSVIVFFWVSSFDIIYSCQDSDFDASIGLHSVPAMIGVKKSLQLSTILHIICAIVVVILGYLIKTHVVYWFGAILFIGLMGYQHSIVSEKDLSRVGIAFGTTNGVASVLFATFTILSFYL